MTSAYDFSATTITGAEQALADYRGKVLLIVNTASKCGFTPQFEGLEKLYRDHVDRGLVVLGFPCDQFAHQDPGTNEEIAEFCQLNYGVDFPMFAKIEVNGTGAHPLYQWLRQEKKGALGPIGGGAIKWNFTKFLVDTEGHVVARYAPSTKPSEMVADIERLLPA